MIEKVIDWTYSEPDDPMVWTSTIEVYGQEVEIYHTEDGSTKEYSRCITLPDSHCIVLEDDRLAANARIKELEAQLAAAQPVQISPLERLEAWRMRHRNRRWEISRTTNIATVTLFFGGIAYTCMRLTLEAAIIGALAKVQGVDHE